MCAVREQGFNYWRHISLTYSLSLLIEPLHVYLCIYVAHIFFQQVATRRNAANATRRQKSRMKLCAVSRPYQNEYHCKEPYSFSITQLVSTEIILNQFNYY